MVDVSRVVSPSLSLSLSLSSLSSLSSMEYDGWWHFSEKIFSTAAANGFRGGGANHFLERERERRRTT